MPHFDAHLFVCTNVRPDGTGCGTTGGVDLHTHLKAQAPSVVPEGKSVRINKSGCLGQCKRANACVMFSTQKEPVWYLDKQVDQLPEILSHLKEILDNQS